MSAPRMFRFLRHKGLLRDREAIIFSRNAQNPFFCTPVIFMNESPKSAHNGIKRIVHSLMGR